MYTNPTVPNFGAGKTTRHRNRTISSPAGSIQFTPTSMIASMTRPPSGPSFGNIPRERKRSLMEAQIAPGLDQIRQAQAGSNHSGADNGHVANTSNVGSNGSSGPNGSSDGQGGHNMAFSIKQEPLDQNLIGLGLGSNSDDAQPEETYHRKRTKSVDMYSSFMGSLTTFTPPPCSNVTPTGMEVPTSLAMTPAQGIPVHSWQPPDLNYHIQQAYHNGNAMSLSGLGSAMPPSTMPMHMQMSAPIPPHIISPGVMGPDPTQYHHQSSMPLPEQTLRHSISHDHLNLTFNLSPQQAVPVTGAKTKTKKAPKAPTKASKPKARAAPAGDAMETDISNECEEEEKDVKDIKVKDVKDVKESKASKAGKDSKDTKETKEKKESKEAKEAKAAKEAKEIKESKEETNTQSGEENTSMDYEGSEIHGDPTARKQKLRYEGDQYTPQWVRNTGQAKEGFCDTCVPGKWLQLKNSAFWYHKQFFHGISSVSGKVFSEPVKTRQMEQDDIEGLCHQCNEWIPISNHKRQNSMLWYRHAHKCHIYHKPKTQGQTSNRSSFSAGQPLPVFSDAHSATQNGISEHPTTTMT